MCCGILALVLLGPRIFGAIWWLFQSSRWVAAFSSWAGGSLWWIWPVLGIIFLPWTTIMYVILAPGGIVGLDWPPAASSVSTGSGLASCSLATSYRTAAAPAVNSFPATKGIKVIVYNICHTLSLHEYDI